MKKYNLNFTKLFNWIKSLFFNGLLILGIYLILIYPIILYITNNEPSSYFYKMCLINFVVSTPLACFIIATTNKPLIIILTSISAVISAIETSMVMMYKEFISAGNMLAILNTTGTEASGFLENYIGVLWYSIPILIVVIIELIILKYTKVKPIFNICLTILCLLLSIFYGIHKYNKLENYYLGQPTKKYYIENNILSRAPYNFYFQCYRVKQLWNERKLIEHSNNFHFHASKNTTTKKKEIYVIALGEALRYDNFSLNGIYHRATTPLLEKNKNIVLYHNYYSNACLTSFSIPQIISRATVDDFSKTYKEKSIFEPFKEVGFKTYAISNKINLLAEEPYLTNGIDSLFVVEHDSQIPQLVDSLLNTNSKIFFMLHFWGNHYKYNNYPKEFDIYHPNINSEPNIIHDSMYVNAYDNTILYTDYLLNSIINKIDSTNAIASLLFTPDHGEIITAVGGGHGYSSSPIKCEYHIPLVIWHSDEWDATHKNKLANLKKHVDDPINGDNIFYSICDMGDIAIDSLYAMPYWSIYNDSLDLHQRKLILRDGFNTVNVK